MRVSWCQGRLGSRLARGFGCLVWNSTSTTLRCRIILDEPRSVTVRIFEVADTSRQFSTLVPKQIMKDAGLPRKLPRQVDTSMPIRCARHHSAKASAVSSGPLSQ